MTPESNDETETKKEKFGLGIRKLTRLGIQLSLIAFLLILTYSIYASLGERFPYFPEYSVFIMLAVILFWNKE